MTRRMSCGGHDDQLDRRAEAALEVVDEEDVGRVGQADHDAVRRRGGSAGPSWP